jgi:hypothetical protein
MIYRAKWIEGEVMSQSGGREGYARAEETSKGGERVDGRRISNKGYVSRLNGGGARTRGGIGN